MRSMTFPSEKGGGWSCPGVVMVIGQSAFFPGGGWSCPGGGWVVVGGQ